MSALSQNPSTEETPPTRILKVAFVLSEVDPLAKVGGLGDVGGALPAALARIPPEQLGGARLDIRLILPFHVPLKEKLKTAKPVVSFQVPTTGRPVKAHVFETILDGLPVYLIDGAPVSKLPDIYGNDPLQMAEKFTFFSLAALHLIKKINWEINVLHAHDWHSALSLYGMETLFQKDPAFRNVLKILSIHNLPFLGEKSSQILQQYLLPPADGEILSEWARLLPLPLGMLVADRIIAVSPTYAQEILTPEFSSGLEEFLRTRSNHITGILNGIDIERWNPASDALIPHLFSSDNLAPRSQNRQSLLEEFGLSRQVGIPLLTFIGRLDYQKGMDLLLKALPRLAQHPWQFILLGAGNPDLEQACRVLEERFPSRVRAVLRYDAQLARRLYAGADMLLMPSRYEPCGLAQMIAMRYGCIPIARATGGLKDTIQDTRLSAGTGFLFKKASSAALSAAMTAALQYFKDQTAWEALQYRCMKQDFSWEKSALEYAKIYLNDKGGTER
ncbi:MAG: glycogen synthase [Anaerolineaceae bacterium]|nr:glycogen synthase [Anaerolineaceae bacterium]